LRHRTIERWSFYTGTWPLDPTRSTLVFIHGAGLSGRLWWNQVDALGNRANTVSIDLPGHGDAPGPHLESIEDMARAIRDFLDDVRPPSPIPVGLSMGGAIVLRLLLDEPDRFQAAVLSNTGAKLGVMPAIMEVLKADFARYLDLSLPFLVSKKTTPDQYRPAIEDAASQDPDVTYSDLAACNVFDVRDSLGGIHAPVLVVTGSDDMMTPPKYGAFLAKAIPNARLTRISEAGHLSPVESPDEFNGALAEFLDEQGL